MLMSLAFLLSALVQFALALVVAALLGPRDFGVYALVMAGAMLAQALLLDGLRMAATRLHHKDEASGLAARLERAYRRIGLGLVALAILLALAPLEHRLALAMAPLVTLANGYADFRLALLRAEFEQKRFGRVMLARSLLAMVLAPLAAYALARPEAALAAFVLATGGASLLAGRAPAAVPGSTPLKVFDYAGPLVLTNALYLALFFALRGGVALWEGLAAAGVLSLALDFVLKLFSTIGTALDLALFPLALRAEREAGTQAGLSRTRDNLGLVLGVLAPMALGLMLVAPGLEPLLVAPAYRGAFAAFVIALTPGVMLYALVQYALHPFAQLTHETRKLALAAVLALLAGGVGAAFGATRLASAPLAGVALGLATGSAAALLWAQAGGAARLGLRYGLSLLACLLLLGFTVAPFAVYGFTPALLAVAMALGALAYAGGAFALDLGGLRALLARKAP